MVIALEFITQISFFRPSFRFAYQGLRQQKINFKLAFCIFQLWESRTTAVTEH